MRESLAVPILLWPSTEEWSFGERGRRCNCFQRTDRFQRQMSILVFNKPLRQGYMNISIRDPRSARVCSGIICVSVKTRHGSALHHDRHGKWGILTLINSIWKSFRSRSYAWDQIQTSFVKKGTEVIIRRHDFKGMRWDTGSSRFGALLGKSSTKLWFLFHGAHLSWISTLLFLLSSCDILWWDLSKVRLAQTPSVLHTCFNVCPLQWTVTDDNTERRFRANIGWNWLRVQFIPMMSAR